MKPTQNSNGDISKKKLTNHKIKKTMAKKTSGNDLIQIDAEYIRETPKSFYLDCEGDLEWFPKSKVKFDPKTNKLLCPRWILNEKFPGEKYDAYEE